MTRHIVLGNGSLLVNIDNHLQVRDLYFPHVGQENHLLGHAHKIGVFSEGKLSWLHEESWEKRLGYLPNTLVSDCVAKNSGIGVELKLHDCVDCTKNVFLRKIEVRNTSSRQREILVFFHHDFHLFGDGIGDTAGFDPKRRALFHYKRNRYFLINALHHHNIMHPQKYGDLHEYSIGTADYNTQEDAADGKLLGNPIAQGSVDSLMSVKLHLGPHESKVFYYWLCCWKNYAQIHELNDELMRINPEQFFIDTKACWEGLLNTHQQDFADLDPKIVDLYKRSILVMRTQIDNNGAIVAANDSDNMQYNKDTYSYVWPRDGALVCIALQKAGYTELTRNFYLFCKDVLSEQGCFLHKYNPDRSLGSSWHPWVRNGEPSLPIQEDGTGLVVYALWHFYETTNDREFCEKLYAPLIKRAAEFMVSFRDEKTKLPAESYDLWEERFGIFTFTCSAVFRGLKSAASFARLFDDPDAQRYDKAAEEIHEAMHEHLYDKKKKRFLRRIHYENEEMRKEDTIDSTLFFLSLFHCCELNEKELRQTISEVKEALWVPTDIGGIARYQGDFYHRPKDTPSEIPGNPWFICTIWLAKYYVSSAKTLLDLEEAKNLMTWVVDRALPTGIIPEQIHPATGEPLSVSPLTWSHAEFVELVVDYLGKRKQLG
ncbi:MAG TPA: glycoside hydrolase family 15 protein [Candidatus Nanoarchaeia archaeon]|nr:glycoside hydrolase family 15 protein [Candidatus Nanoarchaeia archaeon]